MVIKDYHCQPQRVHLRLQGASQRHVQGHHMLQALTLMVHGSMDVAC